MVRHRELLGEDKPHITHVRPAFHSTAADTDEAQSEYTRTRIRTAFFAAKIRLWMLGWHNIAWHARF